MSEGAWRVEIAPAAQRQLRTLPPAETARLRGPILALGIDAQPAGVVRLAGTAFRRLRVGGLRVVHAIDHERHLVVVLRVARRGESTYRRVR